jgi:hypothetical protein
LSLETPAGALRLFPDHDPDVLAAPEGRPLLIARLLEDGDSADLAWLVRNIPEPELAAWLGRRGARQLSVRSRAFWELMLGAGGAAAGGAYPETAAAVRELWLL